MVNKKPHILKRMRIIQSITCKRIKDFLLNNLLRKKEDVTDEFNKGYQRAVIDIITYLDSTRNGLLDSPVTKVIEKKIYNVDCVVKGYVLYHNNEMYNNYLHNHCISIYNNDLENGDKKALFKLNDYDRELFKGNNDLFFILDTKPNINTILL